ncbi:MAG: signal peptidase I [Bacteroidaceae bacterium]|nr:signal peptidase I [Bacteroidaceae bacterium]MBQ9175399.1 signal peptidase I [Bacteroidaceae bacterium]MBR1379280.1 signal peptidase I [Bacteroidaceae bacterium]
MTKFKGTKQIKAERENAAADEKKNRRMNWVKFIIFTILYLAFLYWVGSWWGLIVLPFLFDAYITKKIKWTWWKELESPVARTIMSWVDALVFALVAVYFVNQFFFQNYQIPSSSLEKSLLTGDYLLVSKLSYGPRIPQTPLTMPLTQHTLPFGGIQSYIEWPHWDYRRVKGLGHVEWGDIVVFNYPAGDTVAVNFPGDFYERCYMLGLQAMNEQGVRLPPMKELSTEEQMRMFDQLYAMGKQIVVQQSNVYGPIKSRPTDRRENYVKRCVGLPGQTLQIKDKIIYIDQEAKPTPTLAQFNYYIYAKGPCPDKLRADIDMSDEDYRQWNDRPDHPFEEHRLGVPLTKAALETLKSHTELIDSIVEILDSNSGHVYPLNHDYGWTRDNYGPVWIPKKGESIDLNLDNIAIYDRPIRVYEGHDLKVKDGKIYIDGKEATSYTFTMDYYWMMGDNRHNSADSRYWGFVPEDHVVGKPLFIWWSVCPDSNPEASHIRWHRLFTWVDNIK